MRLRRRLPRGLRPRLLLALLLTSAVTLGIAATVLLSPLPDRLRQQSATNLRVAVTAQMGQLHLDEFLRLVVHPVDERNRTVLGHASQRASGGIV